MGSEHKIFHLIFLAGGTWGGTWGATAGMKEGRSLVPKEGEDQVWWEVVNIVYNTRGKGCKIVEDLYQQCLQLYVFFFCTDGFPKSLILCENIFKTPSLQYHKS